LSLIGAGLAIDFLALDRSNNALPRGAAAGYGRPAIRKIPCVLLVPSAAAHGLALEFVEQETI
jgi:hypothetical protein